MNYSSYLKLFQPVQEQLSGVYSTATLVVSILILLWVINFIVGLISRIFFVGKSVGSFYRAFIHRYIRIFFYGLINLFQKKNNLNP